MKKDASIKLSCLVTNYNQKEWIIDAVESILNQNIQYSYEILIGDDGSDDGSLELLQRKYGQKSWIRILLQDRSGGDKEFPNWRHSRLIFRLIDEARGEYISILDGDDYFCDMNHFQRKIELLERAGNRNCVACYGWMYRKINDRLEFWGKMPYTEGRYQWLEKRPYIHLATSVIRRKALEDVPRNIFYEEFADMGVTIWLAHKGKFYFDPSPCFVYRVLHKSIWNGSSMELKALRSVIAADLGWRAYGDIDGYIGCVNQILTLYKKGVFARDIDRKMWNTFTVKYHAKVAHMLLNKDSLKLNERVWLNLFCFRLKISRKNLSKLSDKFKGESK